jgi:hypothetical protein
VDIADFEDDDEHREHKYDIYAYFDECNFEISRFDANLLFAFVYVRM